MAELKSDTSLLRDVFRRLSHSPTGWGNGGDTDIHAPMVRVCFEVEKDTGISRGKGYQLLKDCFVVFCLANNLKPYRRSYFTAMKNFERARYYPYAERKLLFGKCLDRLNSLPTGDRDE